MKKLIGLMSLLLLAACSPQKSAVKSNVTSGATINGVQMGQCTNSASTIGIIYDQTQNSYNFDYQVKGLLSATLPRNQVGSVSPMANAQTGVRFAGLIKLDSSGNVVGNQSNFKITVYDSVWLSSQTPNNLIEISFTPQKGATISGQFNTQSGDGQLSLRDQYGEIRLTGKIDTNAQSFSGTVVYQNSVSAEGGQPASGNLGQFYISSCALFQ